MVNVTETAVPEGACDANDSGGVHETEAALDFVQIVPDAEPHVEVMVCVKLESALVTVNVCAVPNVPLLADNVLDRAIFVRVAEPEVVTFDT